MTKTRALPGTSRDDAGLAGMLALVLLLKPFREVHAHEVRSGGERGPGGNLDVNVHRNPTRVVSELPDELCVFRNVSICMPRLAGRNPVLHAAAHLQ